MLSFLHIFLQKGAAPEQAPGMRALVEEQWCLKSLIGPNPAVDSRDAMNPHASAIHRTIPLAPAFLAASAGLLAFSSRCSASCPWPYSARAAKPPQQLRGLPRLKSIMEPR